MSHLSDLLMYLLMQGDYLWITPFLRYPRSSYGNSGKVLMIADGNLGDDMQVEGRHRQQATASLNHVAKHMFTIPSHAP